jgi:phosphoglycerate dehydrogenase-like enzyme
MPRFIIANMSPLPESLIESYFAPYLEGLDFEIKVVTVFGKPREEVIKILKEADVVIGDYSFQMKIDEELCNAMDKVRLIQQPSTGFDHIDVEACRRKGIPVANAGGSNSMSVAEYTIMTALALLKRLIYAHEKTRLGEWPQWELMDLGTFDLYGKTWGIIGLGRIGREVAKRLRGWDVRILYYDKVRQEDLEKQLGVEFRSLRRLLRESDIVSIHVPLTPETRGMIGEKELRAMKPGSIIVNPSRGELIDEEALARALKEGWIGGAAVDVYSREPPGKDHPLIKLAREGRVNLIVTPHIAGANTDARQRIVKFSVENILRVLKGEKPQAVVNM